MVNLVTQMIDDGRGKEIHNFFTMHTQEELLEFIGKLENEAELKALDDLATTSRIKCNQVIMAIRRRMIDFIHDEKIPFQDHTHKIGEDIYMSYSLEDCKKLKEQENQSKKGLKNDTN